MKTGRGESWLVILSHMSIGKTMNGSVKMDKCLLFGSKHLYTIDLLNKEKGYEN